MDQMSPVPQQADPAATARLLRACAKLNLPGIRQALAEGADVKAVDRVGRTVLEIVTENAFREHDRYDDCVDERTPDVVRILLENGAAPDGSADDTTPLETFVHRSYPVSKLLVEHGAKVNFVADGEAIIDHVLDEIAIYGDDTPVGIFRGYAKTLDLLVKHGAMTYEELQEKRNRLRKKQKKWRDPRGTTARSNPCASC